MESHRNGSGRKLESGRARRTEKLRREVVGRLDKDNALESKTTQDCRLCLQPGKRLEIWPSYEGGFLE